MGSVNRGTMGMEDVAASSACPAGCSKCLGSYLLEREGSGAVEWMSSFVWALLFHFCLYW